MVCFDSLPVLKGCLEGSFQNTNPSNFTPQVGWLKSSENLCVPERSSGMQWESKRKTRGPKEKINLPSLQLALISYEENKCLLFLCFLTECRKIARLYHPWNYWGIQANKLVLDINGDLYWGNTQGEIAQTGARTGEVRHVPYHCWLFII